MSEPCPKKKMISLRLSEVDYNVLKARYRTYGVRNVSELARLALQSFIDGAPMAKDSSAAKLAEVEKRLDALECQVSFILEHDLSNKVM